MKSNKLFRIKTDTRQLMLLPFGKLKAGRLKFNITKAQTKKMVEKFNQRNKDMIIDYEHQYLKGGTEPIAGFINKVIIKDKGMYGQISKMMPKAQELIGKKLYQHVAPVVEISQKTGEICGIHSISLVPTPCSLKRNNA